MNGKIIAGFIVLSGLVAGAALYYLQVYGYYSRVEATGNADVTLVSLATGEPEPILYDSFQAIDATSSPIRYRACFTTTSSLAMLTETYELAEEATPRNAPGWFDCFDAEEIGGALEQGRALAFIGGKNVEYGVDRIVAITEDGRGYVWHDLNHCGEKAYDGTVVGEDCPPRPTGQ
ncbi:DUF6446 family protein [Marinibacterium sp. SX1]|uniref:DUF6446 family protein n=1 Tax=Marinibacterium sp. SX1 TaxID=3388424 RepID=UPI003D187524